MPPIEANQFNSTLIARTMITDHVLQLTFKRADHQLLDFVPGQFITFLLPDESGKPVRRSYSLANSPGSPFFEVAVAPVGGGFATQILFNLKVGDQLLTTGPKGQLTLKATDQTTHYLLVATNTGVAPYRSMLPTIIHRLESQEALKVTLLLGVCYAKDLLYAADFLALDATYEKFNFRGYLSRETNFTLPYHYKGYVQEAFSTVDLDPSSAIVYLCGNPHMVDESVKLLEVMGFSAEQLRREKYISSKALASPRTA
ncbi:MAG: hypothetical protein K2X94_02705 [Amoebophilaceae bacterium]|nr:hypothetical protein [Amoebophilaceae bacterium]